MFFSFFLFVSVQLLRLIAKAFCFFLQTSTHVCLITDFCPGGELFALLDRQPMKFLSEDSARYSILLQSICLLRVSQDTLVRSIYQCGVIT